MASPGSGSPHHQPDRGIQADPVHDRRCTPASCRGPPGPQVGSALRHVLPEDAER
jgi:hypothetical protein